MKHSVLAGVATFAIFIPLLCCQSDTKKDDTSICSQLANEANEARVEELAGAHYSCSSDADCVVATFGLTCADECEPAARAVARSSEAALRAAIEKVEDTTCADFTQQGCQVEVSTCTPARGIPTARCTDAECQVQYK